MPCRLLTLAVSLAAALAAPLCGAQQVWFSVVGDPADPAADTIQVDPASVRINGNVRTIDLRMSFGEARTTPDGIRFRSVWSMAEVDCSSASARYLKSRFYLEPAWRGEPYQVREYKPDEVREVAFRRVVPNPRERIIRATCSVAPASTGKG